MLKLEWQLMKGRNLKFSKSLSAVRVIGPSSEPMHIRDRAGTSLFPILDSRPTIFHKYSDLLWTATMIKRNDGMRI